MPVPIHSLSFPFSCPFGKIFHPSEKFYEVRPRVCSPDDALHEIVDANNRWLVLWFDRRVCIDNRHNRRGCRSTSNAEISILSRWAINQPLTSLCDHPNCSGFSADRLSISRLPWPGSGSNFRSRLPLELHALRDASGAICSTPQRSSNDAEHDDAYRSLKCMKTRTIPPQSMSDATILSGLN